MTAMGRFRTLAAIYCRHPRPRLKVPLDAFVKSFRERLQAAL
jgi:hypothetical protein